MITEYNFLRDVNANYLNSVYSKVNVRALGKYADQLTPKVHRDVPMKWDGIGIYVNAIDLIWEYPKRIRPDNRWPWPFRLMRPAATVVVEGFGLYDSNDNLLFRFPVTGISHYLRPLDKLVVHRGDLRITI